MTKPLRYFLLTSGLCLALLLAVSQPAWSAIDEPAWQSLGLSGQTIFALAAHPTDTQTLFAGVEQGGVYRTTDGGAH